MTPAGIPACITGDMHNIMHIVMHIVMHNFEKYVFSEVLAFQNSNLHFFKLQTLISRNLEKLWTWELDQTDPYDVPQLSRGVPGPEKDFFEKCFFRGAGVSKFDFSCFRTSNAHSSKHLEALDLGIGPN